MFQIGKIVPYAVWSGCTEIVIDADYDFTKILF